MNNDKPVLAGLPKRPVEIKLVKSHKILSNSPRCRQVLKDASQPKRKPLLEIKSKVSPFVSSILRQKHTPDDLFERETFEPEINSNVCSLPSKQDCCSDVTVEVDFLSFPELNNLEPQVIGFELEAETLELNLPHLDFLQSQKFSQETLSNALLCLTPVKLSSVPNEYFSTPRPRLSLLDESYHSVPDLVLCETETPELDLLQPEKCTRATLSELLLCLVPVPISSLSNDLFSKPRPRLAILDSKLVSEGTKINASRVSVTKKGKQAEASTGVKRQKLTLREEQVENAIKYKENIIVIEKDGGMKEFECRLCQAKVQYERRARAHAVNCSRKKQQRKMKSKPVACLVENCGETFTGKRNLSKHFRVSHPNLVTKYICSVCTHSFTLRKNYRRHIQLHSRNKKGEHCPYCNQISNKSNIARHIKTKHKKHAFVSEIVDEVVSLVCSKFEVWEVVLPRAGNNEVEGVFPISGFEGGNLMDSQGCVGVMEGLQVMSGELMGQVAEEISQHHSQGTEMLPRGTVQGADLSGGQGAEVSGGQGAEVSSGQGAEVFGGKYANAFGGGILLDTEVLVGGSGHEVLVTGIGQETDVFGGERGEIGELVLVNDGPNLITEGRSLLDSENGISPKGVTCDVCGLSSRDMFNLKRHKEKIHGNGSLVKCLHSYCNKGGYNEISVRPLLFCFFPSETQKKFLLL